MEKILTSKGIPYIFNEIDLIFYESTYENIFANKNNKTLLETIKKDRYKHLEHFVNTHYQSDLNIKLGLFLKQLKNNNDLFYKKFLNEYGDLVYCKFKIGTTNILMKKGLYMFLVNNELKYIGRSKDPFKNRINKGYGSISPKNCYLDGQSTNCRINNLITMNRNNSIQLFLNDINDDKSIISLEEELIEENKPEWNIQMK